MTVEADAIRATLDRILASKAFANARRSRDLLRYLVEALLAGRAGELKEYTVGAEALGRGVGFDPRLDSIARVEASRLRSRLELYRAAEGRDDAIVITLPKGGYVPVIVAGSPRPPATDEPEPARGTSPAPRTVWAAVGLLAAAAIFGVFMVLQPRASEALREPFRFQMALGAPGKLANPWGGRLAVSRDGKVLVMQVLKPDGVTALYVRDMKMNVEAREVPGGSPGGFAFLSPDSKWVAFGAGDRQIVKALVDGGGSPVRLADVNNFAVFAGGAWGEDGFVYLMSESKLGRVPENGGELETVFDFRDIGVGATTPVMLPGKRGLLVTISDINRHTQTWPGTAYIGLDGKGYKPVLDRGSFAHYLPTGHLLFVDGAKIFAVKFNLDRLETNGAPWPVMDDVYPALDFASAFFAVSDEGTLAYVRNAYPGQSTIVRITETGEMTPVVAEPGLYISPRLSPDGRKLVFNKGEGSNFGLWVKDLATGVSTMVAPPEENGMMPQWSWDGRQIFFVGVQGLSMVDLDSPGRVRRIAGESVGVFWSMTPGRNEIIAVVADDRNRPVLVTLSLTNGPGGLALDARSRTVRQPALFPFQSSDGKWLAYVGPGMKGIEVYVVAASGEGEPIPISGPNGGPPVWSPTTNHLFYQTLDGTIMRSAYRIENGAFVREPPEVWSNHTLADSWLTTFDVAKDGKSVIAMIPAGTEADRRRDVITIVQNFFETLEAE